jgi:YVTN family beta-propeller protein
VRAVTARGPGGRGQWRINRRELYRSSGVGCYGIRCGGQPEAGPCHGNPGSDSRQHELGHGKFLGFRDGKDPRSDLPAAAIEHAANELNRLLTGSKQKGVEADGTVSVISTATNNVIKTVDVGFLPHSIAISPDGTRAYVTNGGSDSVSVLQLV